MHIAFVVQPAYEHVLPTLPLVHELVSRGNRVSFATGPQPSILAQRAGARAIVLPTELPQEPPKRATFLSEGWKLLARHHLNDARRYFPFLYRHFEADIPNVVCYDSMTYTGRMLASCLDKPDVALFPSFASNERFPLSDELLGRNHGADDREMQDLLIERRLFGAEYGVTEELDAFAGRAVASLNLVFQPREFQFDADAFDNRFRFIGPLPQVGHRERCPPTHTDPLLYISFDNFFSPDFDFYRKCIRAFSDSAWRIVMSIGRSPAPLRDLGQVPDNFHVDDRISQWSMPQHTSVHISQAGMASVMESIRAAVPIVAVPYLPDQEATARRARELRVAYQLDPSSLTSDDLRSAVDQIVHDRRIRVGIQAMRRVVEACGGAAAGADAIESLAERQSQFGRSRGRIKQSVQTH